MGEAGQKCGWDITVRGLAHIPMPAGPTLQTGKPTTPREQAHTGSGACARGDGSKPKWSVGLAERPGRVMASVALSRTFIHIGHALDLLKSMWGTGQGGETDVK